MEVLLITEPPGRGCRGEADGGGEAAARGAREMMTSSGSMPSRSWSRRAGAARRSEVPTSRAFAERLAGGGEAPSSSSPARAGAASLPARRRPGRPGRWEGCGGRWAGRRPGGDLAVDALTSRRRWGAQAGGVGDGGQVQDQVGGAAEGRVDHHGVVQRRRRSGCRAWRCRALRAPARRGPSAGPCRARWGGRRARARVGERHAERFATTWLVAAVPRNWQPPPGEAQARQPIGGLFERDLRRGRSAPRWSGPCRRLRPSRPAA
jgi:hypothetical protein